jgi:hypothetical protein
MQKISSPFHAHTAGFEADKNATLLSDRQPPRTQASTSDGGLIGIRGIERDKKFLNLKGCVNKLTKPP